MSGHEADHGFDEVERYELREHAPYVFAADRREFVQTLGAGLMIVATVRGANAQRRGRRSARRDVAFIPLQRFRSSRVADPPVPAARVVLKLFVIHHCILHLGVANLN